MDKERYEFRAELNNVYTVLNIFNKEYIKDVIYTDNIKVKPLCEKYGVPYNTWRKWLDRKDYRPILNNAKAIIKMAQEILNVTPRE